MCRDAGRNRGEVNLAVQVSGHKLGRILGPGGVLVCDDRCGSQVNGGTNLQPGVQESPTRHGSLRVQAIQSEPQ